MSGHLEAIVSLQKALQSLNQTNELLSGIPDWMRELHDEHSQRQQEIEEAETAQAEAEKENRQAEAELEDVQERAKRLQSQISQVSTQREYGAILKEIDTAKEQKNDLEQKSVEALERAEELKGRLGELRQSFTDLDERYKTELAKWENEKPDLSRKAEEMETAVADAREKLPRNIQVLFERIYDRYGGLATSRVVRMQAARGSNAMWHCEACSYNVRPQIAIEIQNDGTVHSCDSCKRFLYWEPEAEGDD